MAERFKFPSVHQFAVEIARGNSSRRLAWLREFYTSLNLPDLANAVANGFPQPDSAQTSSSTATSPTAFSPTARPRGGPKHTEENPPPEAEPEPWRGVSVPRKKKSRHPRKEDPEPRAEPRGPRNEVLSHRKRQTFARKNLREPLRDVVSPESEEREEAAGSARGHRRTKGGSVSGSGAGGGGLGSRRGSGLGSGEATAFHNGADRRIPSSADLGSTTLSKPAAQEGEKEPKTSCRTSEPFQGQRASSQTSPPPPPQRAKSASSRRSLLTDLIGDTSILDDLLKPKPRGTVKSPFFTAPSASRVPLGTGSGSAGLADAHHKRQVAPKGGRKDFWDILNEGNEESINRLTDPAEVQRVCVNTKFAARGRSEEEERKSLWKTNDKFLWKK